MHFISTDHEKNFYYLLERYGISRGNSPQLEATLYISAVPDIFRLFDPQVFKGSTPPLFALTEWDEEKEEHVFVHPGLNITTREMGEFALSLYNGYPTSLDRVLGYVVSPEERDALREAFNIRAQMY